MENKTKEKKTKTVKQPGPSEEMSFGTITTKADLKAFLANVVDKMSDQVAAPIYAMAAMQHVFNLPNIYELLDKTNREVARDIWLRLKQSGMQVRNPPMIFSSEEDGTPEQS